MNNLTTKQAMRLKKFYLGVFLLISTLSFGQIHFVTNDYFKVETNQSTLINFKESGTSQAISGQMLANGEDGWIELTNIHIADVSNFIGTSDMQTIGVIRAELIQLQGHDLNNYSMTKSVRQAFQALQGITTVSDEATAQYIGVVNAHASYLGSLHQSQLPPALYNYVVNINNSLSLLPSWLLTIPAPEDDVAFTFGLVNKDLLTVTNTGYTLRVGPGLGQSLLLYARKYTQHLGTTSYTNNTTTVLRIEKVGNIMYFKVNGSTQWQTTIDTAEDLRFGIESSTNLLSADLTYSENFQIIPGSFSCVGDGDSNKNWVSSCAYDTQGNVIGSSINYFDKMGRATQSQATNLKYGNIWVSEQRYDNYGRPALTTLSAPKGVFNFSYNHGFMTNTSNEEYSISDLENDPENPAPIGVNSTVKTLGWYYSDDNSLEPYQATTTYPFSRTIYDELNPGNVRKVVGGNKISNEWKTGYSYTLPAAQELYYLYGTGYFKSVGTTNLLLEHRAIKSVSIDPEGNEVVSFSDLEGRVLASARSNSTAQKDVISLVNEQGFIDIHLPKGCEGTLNYLGSSSDYKVYNLRTGLEETTITNLSSGIYRVVAQDTRYTNAPSLVYVNKTNGTLAPFDAVNNMGVSYKVNYHDWSLNYYDKAGNLQKTIQPTGIDYSYTLIQDLPNHTMENTSVVNSLGQLQQVSSPDEGTSSFVYRKDGQIRYSQNTKQAALNEVSYTNYDSYGRPIESGVLENASWTQAQANPDGVLITGNKREEQYTLYDVADISGLQAALTSASIPTNEYAQSFLSGAVSKTWTQNPDAPSALPNIVSTTWYSYDIYGRVQWVVQNINGLGVKTIDYTYDYKGNVQKVIYQKHVPSELFVHQYSYDVGNELTLVETSTDNTNFEIQTRYHYYQDGKLKRVELAEGLQGTDYVYTLGGALKSINHPSLEQANDPGQDGNDIFGMTIDYYSGDYTRTGTAITSSNSGQDSYVGNIKATRWATKGLTPNGTQQAQLYFYNDKQWLTEARFGTSDSNGNITTGEEYKVSGLTYDRNGNLLSLNRNSYTLNGDYTMDQFTYNYNSQTNQLNHVQDAVSMVRFDDLASQSNNHYSYNSIGQLTTEQTAIPTHYNYNTSGLVKGVGTNLGVNDKNVNITYNDRNNRLIKDYDIQGFGGTTTTRTYYVRDISGNIIATYTQNLTNGNPNGSPQLQEHTIYGNGRIGLFTRANSKSIYQVTDHLGNVRAVIARNDITYETEATNYTDYYPFGMVMPNRQLTDGTYRYAYQGQEKDSETGKEAFELRQWDGRIGRWLTTDPYGEFYSPYLGMGNNPITKIDPDGGMTLPPKLLYDLGGYIDDFLSFYSQPALPEAAQVTVNNLSRSRFSDIFGFQLNQITPVFTYIKRNISIDDFYTNSGGTKHDCLTQVCRATAKLYPEDKLSFGKARFIDLPGNAKNLNNMNKTMQHLININKASPNQIQIQGSTIGNIGQQIFQRTAPNTFSVWGYSLNDAFHSLMIFVDRTDNHLKIHITDQWNFETYNSVDDFSKAIQKKSDKYSGAKLNIFTQFKN